VSPEVVHHRDAEKGEANAKCKMRNANCKMGSLHFVFFNLVAAATIFQFLLRVLCASVVNNWAFAK
jgi:hypothetical protein